MCEIVAFFGAKEKSDQVCSTFGLKIRTLYQLYSCLSGALFSSGSEKSESEDRFNAQFKCCLPKSVSLPDLIPLDRN